MKNKILICTVLIVGIFIYPCLSAVQGPDYNDIRAIGMGNTSTAVSTDRTAIFHNPAGLGLIKDKFQCSISPLGFSIDGAFFQLLNQMFEQGDKLSDLNNVDQDFMDMINKFDRKWAGFSYIPEITMATKYFGFGVYTVLPIGIMIESGHLIPKLALKAERDIVFTASVGFPIKNDKNAIGFSLKYYQRTPLQVEITKYSETFKLFDDISKSPLGIVGDYSTIKHGVSIDIGFMHNPLPGFRFAWGVNDLIGFLGGEYVAPPRLNLGCSYFFPQLEKVKAIDNLIIAFEISNLFGVEKTTEKYEHFAKKLHIGTELDLHYIALRLGISQGYPTIGIGIKYSIFKADYAFYTEELGYYPGQFPDKKHLISLGMNFGVSEKKAKKPTINAGNLYNRAKALYTHKRYYDAMILFSRILVEVPKFFKNDLVKMHIAQSQELLDMQKISKKTYLDAIKDYPKSPILNLADLGLLRLSYRSNDSAGVELYFAKLNRVATKDSLRHEARYYYGQFKLNSGGFEKAISVLNEIPRGHPDYIFAQHSLGIAYASIDSINMAITPLVNAIHEKSKTESEQKIVDRSLIMLGYIFYEKSKTTDGMLPKAVAALRRVSDTSYYFEDALLGLGWCGLSASQFEDCIKACQKLRVLSGKKVLHAESMLLEAYAYTSQKKYEKALSLLQKANKLINSIKITNQTKSQTTGLSLEYAKTNANYALLSKKLEKLMMTKKSRKTQKIMDSLRVPQVEFQANLLKLSRSIDEYKRDTFFSRNIKNVQTDITYALIKTEKAINDKKLSGTLKNAVKKAQGIDEKMEKLQNELEELNEESVE